MEDFKFWSVILGETDNPIFVTVLFIMGLGLTLSKKAAEIKGPLGAAGRWWQNREIRRIERAQAVWRARHGAEDEQKDARIEDMTKQIEYLKRVLKDVREELVTANARSDRNFHVLETIDSKVGTMNSKLDHPSRLPGPPAPMSRARGDTEPMDAVPAFTD